MSLENRTARNGLLALWSWFLVLGSWLLALGPKLKQNGKTWKNTDSGRQRGYSLRAQLAFEAARREGESDHSARSDRALHGGIPTRRDLAGYEFHQGRGQWEGGVSLVKEDQEEGSRRGGGVHHRLRGYRKGGQSDQRGSHRFHPQTVGKGETVGHRLVGFRASGAPHRGVAAETESGCLREQPNDAGDHRRKRTDASPFRHRR